MLVTRAAPWTPDPPASLQRLVGVVVREVSLTDFTWGFQFGEVGTLCTNSLWRVLVGGRHAFGSGDHGQKYGLPAPKDAVALGRARLVGRRAVEIAALRGTGDLRILLEGGVTLEIFATSTGYEPWQVYWPDGSGVFANGGNFSEFPPAREER